MRIRRYRHQRLRLAPADVALHAHLCVPPPRLRGCWSGAFAAPCPPPTPPLRKRLAWRTHCASRSSRSTPRCPRAARPAPRATTWPGAPLIYAPQRTHHALTASRHAALRRLCSAHDTVVPARGKALVKTDLSIAIPEGTYARIAPRSGLAWKNFIDTGAGVSRPLRLAFTLRHRACLRCGSAVATDAPRRARYAPSALLRAPRHAVSQDLAFASCLCALFPLLGD